MKVLLVDDERLARAGMRRMLAEHSDITVAGEAKNTQEAAALVERLHPDLIFLDVEMPGQNGLEWLESLDDLPTVIFTTAYQEYAVRAFNVCALDYLVKPIAVERLAAALEKARRAMARPSTTPGAARNFFVREGERCWIVRPEQIQLLESEGNYTRVYFDGNRPLIHRSLQVLEERLDPAMFLRASRTHIVNLQAVRSLKVLAQGGLLATLADGSTITISRRQSRKMREMLSL